MLTKIAKTRVCMLAVLSLFIVPVLLAVLLVWGPEEWRPTGMANHGILVIPPQPFALSGLQAENGKPFQLKEKWTLIVIDGGGQCADACRRALHDTRQVRLATGKEMDRVRRLYISRQRVGAELRKFLLEQHSGLLSMLADSQWGGLPDPQLDNPFESGRIYLVDPKGLLMMYFPAGLPAKGLLKDLQRLMKLA